MYVTRALSTYRRDPSSLSLPPPGGPNSGILVIQDEEAQPTTCFGLCKSNYVEDLPIPQNKNTTIRFSTGEHEHINSVAFIPVVSQPVSSNRYYVIQRHGLHKGEAYKSSKEEDMETCCFGNCITDLKPQALDPQDKHQQFEVQRVRRCTFVARSVISDGFPPTFLRRKGWMVSTSTARDFELNEAQGLDIKLRSRLPNFNFSLALKSCAPLVVGRWYCPFMFIKEGTLKDQMSRSMYYAMTLEQRWERMFECERVHHTGNSVTVDAAVRTKEVAVAGKEALFDEKNATGGVVWFRSHDKVDGEVSIGLAVGIVERMNWEQARAGWVGGDGGKVSVKRVEEFGGSGEWKKFGCYVLVERFVLKRMDGSLAMTQDFRHTHHIRCKWE